MRGSRQAIGAVAAWFVVWAGLLAWSNLATETSPPDHWSETATILIFGIGLQLMLGVATGRAWTALCPFVLMLVVTAIVAIAWDDSGEGPIGVAVLWAFAIPASIVILVGVLIRRRLLRASGSS